MYNFNQSTKEYGQSKLSDVDRRFRELQNHHHEHLKLIGKGGRKLEIISVSSLILFE